MSICKERAFDLLTKISFERIAGTDKELECANILKEECEKVGVEAVIEAFEIDMPEILEASLEIPGCHTIPCIGIGKCGNTPDEGITAPFVYAEEGLPANLLDAKGKIVLLTGPLKPEVREALVKAEVAGFIQATGSLYDPQEMIPELRTRSIMLKPEENFNIPGVLIHITEANKLVLENPSEIKLVAKQDADKKGTSHNVVATIKGTEKPEEIITFSAHFDSVIYSTGAWDNGTGTVTIMEIMHHFLANPPKRTLQFVWCGSEEIGLCGSLAFTEAHKEKLKNHLFNINVDMTGVLLGYEKAVCSCEDSVAKYIEFIGKLEGYPITTKIDMYPSDSSSFVQAGVPAVTFARLAPQGGMELHSRRDNMEYLDAEAFIKTVGFMIRFAEPIVNAKVFPVSKTFPKELTESMERFKKMFGDGKKKEPKEEKKD